MTRPTPLPWVKSWTGSMTDFDWLSLPIEIRGVFGELAKVAGIQYPRGVVKGTDESIAAGLRVETKVLTAAIDRLAAKPHKSLKRISGGLKVVNWEKYQAPAMVLSHAQRGPSMATRHTEIRGREEKEKTETRHGLLDGYDSWIDQPGDTPELTRLVLAYPSLDLADELRGFMAYADRRAGEGNGYVDYIDAFRNRLKAQFEYYKKRGWLTQPDAEWDNLPVGVAAPGRIG